jgi:hypothetical protein
MTFVRLGPVVVYGPHLLVVVAGRPDVCRRRRTICFTERVRGLAVLSVRALAKRLFSGLKVATSRRHRHRRPLRDERRMASALRAGADGSLGDVLADRGAALGGAFLAAISA